ncbi:MAG TPA: FHA domain-containing protein [Gemmataceae bacterium]|nr:FHA domain-containing protein [Gemmataceae bacterium]
MDATPQASPRPDPPPSAGELVVVNGRLSGARKALGAALTLFGRAEGCDVRLNVEGVHPVHCAVVPGPGGMIVRSLHGAVTRLNGQPIAESPLRDGDMLAVGPFQFRVALSPAPEVTEPPALESEREALRTLLEATEREKDALRIQAAAVAAQQAALTEEETRLQQRRVALERQEGQLSAHLEERRRKLVELQNQVREGRMVLRNERAEQEKRVAQTTAELQRARREAQAGQEKLQAGRRQLTELHRRLKRRHGLHWRDAEAGLQKREERLAEERRKLEADRAAQQEARLRFNGEIELGRRKLQDGWDELRRQHKQWEERRAREDADLQRRAREVSDNENNLAEQWQYWEDTRQTLEAEAEGLETRVRNLRRKVHEQEAQRRVALLAPPAAAPAEAATAPLPAQPELDAEERERLTSLEGLAQELADQRMHLLEQFTRLARAQEEWRAEQLAALAEVEEAARRLQEREGQLEPRQRGLAEAEADLTRRAAELTQVQTQLDAWQGRLTAREAAWDADRERLLAGLHSREEAARQQGEALADLRRRWVQRRKKDIALLRTELQRCGAARRQYAAMWEVCLNHGSSLEQQQRALAERTLALEQYRLEVLGRAPDSAAAEKRLERLRRRCAAPTAAARRNLDRERQALDAERKRLQGVAQQLDKQVAALAERETELSRRLAEWELGKAGADAARAQLQAEVAALTAQRAHQEREVHALRDEVERLARLLIDDGPTLLPAGHAA